MRRICALSVIVAAAGAATFASSASASVVAQCTGGATLGIGVPIPAASPLPPDVPYPGSLTTGPSCSMIGTAVSACGPGCRATVQAGALAGIVHARVSAFHFAGPTGDTASADCGPVLATPAVASDCRASVIVPATMFVATCSMEGIATVFPGVFCTLEKPPFV